MRRHFTELIQVARVKGHTRERRMFRDMRPFLGFLMKVRCISEELTRRDRCRCVSTVSGLVG